MQWGQDIKRQAGSELRRDRRGVHQLTAPRALRMSKAETEAKMNAWPRFAFARGPACVREFRYDASSIDTDKKRVDAIHEALLFERLEALERRLGPTCQRSLQCPTGTWETRISPPEHATSKAHLAFEKLYRLLRHEQNLVGSAGASVSNEQSRRAQMRCSFSERSSKGQRLLTVTRVLLTLNPVPWEPQITV